MTPLPGRPTVTVALSVNLRPISALGSRSRSTLGLLIA